MTNDEARAGFAAWRMINGSKSSIAKSDTLACEDWNSYLGDLLQQNLITREQFRNWGDCPLCYEPYVRE